LVEAVGSSMTPFVPLPFVDDYLFARLLRRIARKVIGGDEAPVRSIAKTLVDGYTKAGEAPLGEKALSAAARFVVRKVAVVLDVKRSHDVFGEAIIFALALDVAVAFGAVQEVSARSVGEALHRSVQTVGSAAIEVLSRAGRDAFTGEGDNRFMRVAEAIGKQVDEAHAQLRDIVQFELSR
jgi:hypothetical protein